MYLGTRGYTVPKSCLTERKIDALKKELTVSPLTIAGYGPAQTISFKTYMESETKLYLPKCYGLEKFGLPLLKIPEGDDIDVNFIGSLRPIQHEAIAAVLSACRDPMKMGGLLCLGCGFGKTVCAISMICTLAKKTLIVVHKEFLLDQWKERIAEFAPTARVGLIKAKVIDVEDKDIVIASLQSLSMKEYESEVFRGFGNVVYDEVHHMSSQVFSQALKKCNFKYSIGLTATPKRKDGLTKVFKWFLGDIAFESEKRTDVLQVRFKEYYSENPKYSKEYMMFNGKPNISRMINSICEYQPRVEFIVKMLSDVLGEEAERRVLLLSDRRNHLHLLHESLTSAGISSGFYYGGLSASQLKESESKQILLATFQYASEGFDMKGLDTLVLASPKSDVVQVAGRILRDKPEDRKHIPLILDIVDDFAGFPNQGAKRHKYYKSCKYEILDSPFGSKAKKKNEVCLPVGQCIISTQPLGSCQTLH